ncbi:conserved hypothetical protein [Trichinella spiralis]|uniref:hypothetical protein n=1 Tax=Trichinella spiralis TaxID=6334 RepID=UPI0001EFDAC3|nr:conserved hypothetical protein [Trichinella spiralis]
MRTTAGVSGTEQHSKGQIHTHTHGHTHCKLGHGVGISDKGCWQKVGCHVRTSSPIPMVQNNGNNCQNRKSVCGGGAISIFTPFPNKYLFCLKPYGFIFEPNMQL